MSRPRAGRIRVLLVADREADCTRVRDALERAGVRDFTLEWEPSIEAARRRMGRRQHQLYLLADRIGGEDGMALLEQVRDASGHVPAVVLLSRENRALELRALRAGAAYYLVEDGIEGALLERVMRHALEVQEIHGALRESEAYTRAVLESAVDGMITIDDSGVIETFNHAAEEIFGYPAAAAIGRNVAMLMPQPYAAEHDGYIRRYLDTGEKRVIGIGREVVGRRSDGTEFPLDLAISEVRVRGARRFLGIVRDITARKRVEAELREAQEGAATSARLADIGAITAQIVHDIGNPVAGVVMQTNAILRSLDRVPPPPPETLRRQLERVLTTARTLDHLVKSFLDFSREQRLALALTDVAELLRELAAAWQPFAAQRGVDLHLALAGGLPPILADADKLRRVLENLLKNAVEAIDQGPGSVTLRAEALAEGGVRLSVEDTGPGMPEGIDPFRLFETTKAAGTGLGLPIVSQIVQAHRGRITHRPNRPRGTVFSVELPLRPA